ncbi:MAG TPA: hypothetical protein VEA16_14755 [Vicinamibacterales bacterium]|nr:hypothetical protein [Vicinamibacterales bacterium]
MTARSAGPQRGSPARYVAALVCLGASLVTLAGGFLFMVRALEQGGYGTSSNTLALVWLAAGGGLLALGIALLIWELSVRHNIRH